MAYILVHSLNLSSVDTVHRPTVHLTFFSELLRLCKNVDACVQTPFLLRNLVYLYIFRQFIAILQHLLLSIPHSIFVNGCEFAALCHSYMTGVKHMLRSLLNLSWSGISISPKE